VSDPSSQKSLVLIWAGRVLMTVSIVFIAVRLWEYRRSVGDQLAKPELLASTIIFCVIYAMSGLLLALGWWLILCCRSDWGKGLKWKTATLIYGKTQIAKYIPGNIFHFAGRHVLARNAGASHAQLVAAATGEILMTLTAAGLISLLAVRSFLERVPGNWIWLGVLAAGTAMALGVFAFRRFGLMRILQGAQPVRLILAQFSYLLFFAVSASLFLLVIMLVADKSPEWQLVAGCYAAAWAIGFVVPGAPGGFGVRETMLVAFLSGVLEEKTILLAAILFRLVTTCGDFLFFLGASVLSRRIDPS
jgi:uncharacterized membrane protein YbhN (UPF0104 family)